jgi:hypothetical protein
MIVVFALVMVMVTIAYNPAYGYLIPQPDINYSTFLGYPTPYPAADYYAWHTQRDGPIDRESVIMYDPFEISTRDVITCGDYFTIEGRAQQVEY